VIADLTAGAPLRSLGNPRTWGQTEDNRWYGY
jgi:hypothetical protein